jgi:hypothetical protein
LLRHRTNCFPDIPEGFRHGTEWSLPPEE